MSGTHHDVAELLGGGESAAVAHDVLEGLVALFAEGAGCGLDVLLGQSRGYVGRHEVVLCHHFGLEPYTHGVVGAEAHHITHALHTLELGDDIDFHVVVQELRRVSAGSVHQRHAHEHGCLAFFCLHAHLVHFGRQKVRCRRHAVLHVHSRHVGVETLAEVHVDGCAAGVCGRGFHVCHAFGAVDAFLEGRYHGVEHGGGVGAVVGCGHRDCRWRDVGILGNRQGREPYDAEQDDEYGYHRREHRPVYKRIKFHS